MKIIFKGVHINLWVNLYLNLRLKLFKLIKFTRVRNSQDIEELIADSMTGLMIRAERLNEFDQLAISQEFREWLNEGVRLEDISFLVLMLYSFPVYI